MCPQTFIVKFRIPVLGCTSMLYSRTERRGNRLVARETERERLCVRLCVANEVGVRCKKGRLGKGCHESLHIKVVCLRNYLNCEKGIKERTTRERYIKITSCRKQSGDAQGHLRNNYILSTFSTYGKVR